MEPKLTEHVASTEPKAEQLIATRNAAISTDTVLRQFIDEYLPPPVVDESFLLTMSLTAWRVVLGLPST